MKKFGPKSGAPARPARTRSAASTPGERPPRRTFGGAERGAAPARASYRKPEGDAPVRKSYRKPEGEAPRRSFRKPEGDAPPRRSFRKPEGDAPPRRSFRKPEGDAPPRAPYRRLDADAPPRDAADPYQRAERPPRARPPRGDEDAGAGFRRPATRGFTVTLDPDVARVFRGDASVNKALRLVMQLMQVVQGPPPRAERAGPPAQRGYQGSDEARGFTRKPRFEEDSE